ncbi:MAG TPA: hypothetical protein VHK90_02295, partial [Thermoanaerobaculia bacterium]|nr:hypothetical protein [Thermoanaerobaculia bacterium]
MLIIATGVNDVIAGAVARYEPLYVYLAAVALIAWLDGAILGALSALAATAMYALLFMPRPDALGAPVLLPLGAAFAAVVVVTPVRALARRRRRDVVLAAAPVTPLLTPSPPPPPDLSEVLQAIDELRTELRGQSTPGR